MHNQTRSLVLSREHYRARSHRSMSEMSKSKSDSPRKRTGSTDQCQCCDSLALPQRLLFSITLKHCWELVEAGHERFMCLFTYDSTALQWWNDDEFLMFSDWRSPTQWLDRIPWLVSWREPLSPQIDRPIHEENTRHPPIPITCLKCCRFLSLSSCWHFVN